MYRPDIQRIVASSILLCLFHHPTSAAADCVEPSLDPRALVHLRHHERRSREFDFQDRVHEFIACKRRTLERRARGLAAHDVRQLVLRDREIEDRVLAGLTALSACVYQAKLHADPAVARANCMSAIQSHFRDRLPRVPRALIESAGGERQEFGGIWSFQTLDLERPGHCNDAPCDHMFAVEVTNTTPIALTCEVALTLANPRDGVQRGDQVITLYPGDSLPAVKVQIREYAEEIAPEVTCTRAMPLAPARAVPAACRLEWMHRELDFPRSFSYGAWESGVALVEIATREGYQPPQGISVIHADSPAIGHAARRLIEKQRFGTSCPRQRFRIRVEYRAFPCHGCAMEGGVVTMLRDDRPMP